MTGWVERSETQHCNFLSHQQLTFPAFKNLIDYSLSFDIVIQDVRGFGGLFDVK